MNDNPEKYENKRDFYEEICVRFQFEGFHRWKDAPTEVAFLRDWHRHIFHCEARVSVEHDDRELEYFMVLNEIKKHILPFLELGDETVSSCEQKAKFIANGLINIYGEDRDYEVSVFEDGENGSTVKWPR